MIIQPCRSYRAVDAGRTRLAMPGGRSVFKVYYVSITGRDDPTRYEWGKGEFAPADFERLFRAAGLEGVGFVTAFPHITKVFRFAPAAETILHVQAYDTRTLKPLDLGRGEGWMEFACYAEALVAADEYRAWAEARSVDSYLEAWSDFAEGPIAAHDKLLSYYNKD
jgi:hypothetical protein